ncbi:hypothetical protein WR25_00958 [Diploscapter pachys]|uniref:Uncharacterized protein n=1 Tax=Diploscapter pachys TaxID=2018661 RepID=A0A2A2L9V9_9BILA|nr:hypothetical protein WR25_00958 [Diploscapter pachys]
MGNKPSLEDEKSSVERKHPIELKFPSFLDDEEAFLQHKKNTATVLEKMPTLVDKLVTFSGGPAGGGTVVRALMSLIHDSPDSVKEALKMLKVERKIAQNAHSFVKAEMKSIERQLDLSLSGEGRKMHLAIADDSCYKLLIKFDDTDFYLRQQPLAYAPFLVSFVAIYIAVTCANYSLTVKHRKDVVRNLKTLREIIKNFRDETAQSRVNYIHVRPALYTEGDYYLYDSLIDENIYYQPNLMFTPHFCGDIKEWYQEKVRRKYEKYFAPSLSAVEEALEEIRE